MPGTGRNFIDNALSSSDDCHATLFFFFFTFYDEQCILQTHRMKIKSNVIGPFIFEEAVVTGDTFLAMMDNTTLHHVLIGTVQQPRKLL
jgi:hypothetical protein